MCKMLSCPATGQSVRAHFKSVAKQWERSRAQRSVGVASDQLVQYYQLDRLHGIRTTLVSRGSPGDERSPAPHHVPTKVTVAQHRSHQASTQKPQCRTFHTKSRPYQPLPHTSPRTPPKKCTAHWHKRCNTGFRRCRRHQTAPSTPEIGRTRRFNQRCDRGADHADDRPSETSQHQLLQRHRRRAKQAAMDRQTANGGLGEYYSEGETRIPTWLVVGDKSTIGRPTGLTRPAREGGDADTEARARVWLDEGIAPNGAHGRAFTENERARFRPDVRRAQERVAAAGADRRRRREGDRRRPHQAVTRRWPTCTHAGYTRVHNPLTGNKDLQRLPGLVAIAYQHETSRCGDPHLHTHVIVPNRQPRADGQLVSIDSKSLHHEAKAAGIIYQAALRHELHAERGFEWNPVDEHTGMAEIAGVDQGQHQGVVAALHPAAGMGRRQPGRRRRRAHRRATGGRAEGHPPRQARVAGVGGAQGAVARRCARPARWTATRTSRRAPSGAAHTARALDRARIAEMAAHIDKAAFTRADMVELVGAQLPVDAPGDPRALIERDRRRRSACASARRARRTSARATRSSPSTRSSPRRNASSRWSTRPTTASRLDVRTDDLGDLSADQERAIRNIAVSPFLVQPLAGARRRGQDALTQGAARRRAPGAQGGAGAGADRQGRRRGDGRRRRRPRPDRRQGAAC